jgi:hypothetical protein
MKFNEEKQLLSARYHPFQYLLTRSGKELAPIMEEFLELMESPDETKMDKKLFRISHSDVELSGRFLWDVVLRESLVYSRFMRRFIRKSGELLLKPPATFFYIHPHLSSEYMKDDSVSFTCEGLEDSFGPIYIHFGKKAGITTSDGQKTLDGAYVVSEWNSEKKSLIVEVLLAPEAPKNSKEFRQKSLLRRMAEDAGYIYFWLAYSKEKDQSVYEVLEQNIVSNNQGIPTQVLLHNQLQLREVLKSCRILVPFLKDVTRYLTLAREHGLGRDPDCNLMDSEGIHIRRAEKKGTELLLVDVL